MKKTRVSPNVARSTKLRGTQRFPEITRRSTDFFVQENLIFLAFFLMHYLKKFDDVL